MQITSVCCKNHSLFEELDHLCKFLHNIGTMGLSCSGNGNDMTHYLPFATLAQSSKLKLSAYLC